MPTDPKLVRDHFLATADLGGAERAAYLATHCGGDAALRAAVERLLAAHDQPASILNRPGPGVPLATGEFTPDPADAPPQVGTTDYYTLAQPGAVIAGRYTLHEKIGEGGMGEVWVAKQIEPVKRQVALKLVKAGMDTKAVLHRFEAERKALALMDHPNIAKVLDGGMTADRRPFFVMELVNGLALTKFCDEVKLGIRERLELFAAICQAVQHAHQKGIIHRDLKPSNILVTLIDARPVPKVIDFGVAKAIGGKLLDESLSTQFGAVVGTLEYMAPEQAGFSSIDIDTRADIYSLGVILYELLTGLRPIDTSRLKKAAYTEVIRILHEEEPSKPSTRLSTDEALPSLAASRHIEPNKLMALLRGELDWVVMKCLNKQRERRYETANGLARDVQRYLADQPVEARPPSAGYRFNKFLRRNKGPVIAASLVMLALVTGIVGTTFGLVRASQRAEGERLAKIDAEAKRAEAVIQQTRAEAGEKLAGERLVQVEAEKQNALEEKRIAQSVRDFFQHKLLGQADSRSQADALLRSGGLASEAKKNPTIRELLDRAAKELTVDKIEVHFRLQPLLQAEILQTVGETYRGIGDFVLAIEFLQRAAMLRERYLGSDHPDTLTTLNNLAVAFQAAGNLREAIKLHEQVLDSREKKLGAAHQDTLHTVNDLAVAYRDAGRTTEAIAMFERVLHASMITMRIGAGSVDLLATLDNLAGAYRQAGRLDEAIETHKKVRDVKVKKLGIDHPSTLTTLHNLALVYHDARRLKESIALLEQVRDSCVTKFGADHPDTLMTVGNLGISYKDAGRLTEAIPLLEEAHRASSKFPKLRSAGIHLLDAYTNAGRSAEAAKLLQELLREARRSFPEDSSQLAGGLAQIGSKLLQLRAYTDAEPLLRESLSIREKTEAEGWSTFNTQSMLGGALLGQQKYADAELLLLKGYEGMKQREATIPANGKIRLTEALNRLVQLYEAMDKKVEAAKWRKVCEEAKSAEMTSARQ